MNECLSNDETFFNKEIEATMDYVKTIEIKFRERIQEFRSQLAKINEENIKISKDNREQFEKETEKINSLFDSGILYEALKKCTEYEKQFARRKTVINDIPKLHMNEQMIVIFRKNDTKSPTTNPNPQSMFRFSTRLGPSSSNTNTSVSHRNISTPPTMQNTNVISHNNQEQVRLTPPTPPNSVRFLTEQPTTSDENSPFKILNSIPVLEYYIEPNYHLLMTCNAEFIVLYKSQITRLDRWRLDAIQRGSHNSYVLDWHDGLIISMGLIEKNTIYMFTEHEFFMYSITSGRKIDARMLPRGTDDGSNINSVPYNNSQRGIGAVYGDFMYHIYLNHHSQWTLSKTILDKLARTPSYNLTTIFPDVERFIHFCVNAKTINFLVQMNDSSYAVVFCSVKNCNSNEYRSTVVTLLHAQQPLTICSAYIRCQDKYIFYINDPSIDILHAIDIENYLYASQILAHAICYVENKEELMIVTNNSICSINVNEENSILKNFR
ncbi:unnamed protein product [Adineta steineri]|uniref:Uncharacterized protein n=1 Tax=Adineta steineri TaxID=433720 RepID=A0A814G144_9BILA|nr:unnamed protein product [Adineta steineri]